MHDIVIIGAGTAGMTAALYALRNGKSVLLLEGNCYGGQIANSPRVENYPSVKEISGAELSDRLFDQVTSLGADFELERVERIDKTENGTFEVKTDYGVHAARAVILATGVKHKTLGVLGEAEYVGNGVSYCAVCDGAFYAGREVALVGDANTALQYSILLSNYCKKVYVCTWMDKFFADKALVDTLFKRDNVEWVKNVCCTAIKGDGELTAVELTKTDDKQSFELPVAACFVAIGQIPDNKAFENVVELDESGYIIAGEDTKTRTDGVFAAGDCRVKAVRQLTTAVGDGATAAMMACRYIE